MDISWFGKNTTQDVSEHLFTTEGSLPEIGKIVFFRDMSMQRGGQSKKYLILESNYVVMQGSFAFDCMKYPPDMENASDRLDFAAEYIRNKWGGKLNDLDRERKMFIYTRQYGEVTMTEIG